MTATQIYTHTHTHTHTHKAAPHVAAGNRLTKGGQPDQNQAVRAVAVKQQQQNSGEAAGQRQTAADSGEGAVARWQWQSSRDLSAVLALSFSFNFSVSVSVRVPVISPGALASLPKRERGEEIKRSREDSHHAAHNQQTVKRRGAEEELSTWL